MEVYYVIFFRVVTIMVLTLFLTLIVMGKKSIHQLPAFDFLTVLVLGNVVSAVIADPTIEHLPTVFAVVLLAGFNRFITVVSLRYSTFRRKVSFEPTIVIQDGRMVYQNIKKIKYSLDNILMLLRLKDIFDIEQVQYAIIEANGGISILKKPEYESLSPKDMSIIISNPQDPPITVIADGEIQIENLHVLHISVQDLLNKLSEQGYQDYKKIFYAAMNQQGKIHISPHKFDL